jgi:aspartate aminotransferase
MQFSRRIQSIPGSPTVALNAKANELQKAGAPVINFTVGEPDFPTPDIIVETAITSLRKGRTKYGSPGGGMPLRKAISDKFKRENQLEFEPANIVAGMGAKEILFHLCLGLLNEEDEVIVMAPYWVSYTAHVQAAGAKASVVPMPVDFPKTRLDIAAIERAATPNTRMFILNSPNNPAGYVLDESELRRLGEYLLTKDWWIISDEIYEYLSFTSEHRSLLNYFPELRDRFILVHGVAKNFAMTGWRVGYACCPPAVAKVLTNLQSQSSTCLPGFIEDAAQKAFELGKALVRTELVTMKMRSDLAFEHAATLPDCSTFRPEGAFYLFIDVRPLLGRNLPGKIRSAMDLCGYLLDKYHVALVPGEAFGAPGFLRLSYATSDHNITEGLKRMRQAFLELISNEGKS